MKNSPEIDTFLQSAIEDGAFPGAAYAIGTPDKTFVGTVGKTRYKDQGVPITQETQFDLASLTKVIGTTTFAMHFFPNPNDLVSRKVQDFVPEYPSKDVTVGNLLKHDSGMPAYDGGLPGTTLTREETKKRELCIEPSREPGERTVYSCLNFVLLKECIERSQKIDFEKFALSQVGTYCPTLHLPRDTSYATTETMEAWRPMLEQYYRQPSLDPNFVEGIVHDPVAYYNGGVSGNAGLFANIKELQKYGHKWVTEPESYSPHWKDWVVRQGPQSSRALGWDTKSPTGSSAGTLFGKNSFGHTGFTGTTIWIDPDAKMYAVLLTNRVHPTSDNGKITQVRPKFHDLSVKVLNSTQY